MTAPVASFGPLIVETDVDRAIVETLRRWVPTYLHRLELERDLQPNTFARPRPESYSNTLDDDSFPDGALPAIIVTTAQLQDTDRTGDGYYLATWKVIVSSVVRGRNPSETRALASLFGGTVRRLLTQQSDLGGAAADTRWVAGGAVAPVSDRSGQNRWLAAGINHFEVDVDDVLSTSQGPRLPDPFYPDPDPENSPDQDYVDPATVNDVIVDVGALDRS